MPDTKKGFQKDGTEGSFFDNVRYNGIGGLYGESSVS